LSAKRTRGGGLGEPGGSPGIINTPPAGATGARTRAMPEVGSNPHVPKDTGF